MATAVRQSPFVHKTLEQLLPLEKMEHVADTRAQQYQSADPFPHIAIDNFFPTGIVEELEYDFPGPTDPQWLRFKGKAEQGKLQSTSELAIPISIRNVIHALNSPSFVRFLERLTGIESIIPDPHLYGGGMHQTPRGGFLKMHIDYNRHNTWKLDRRLNAILYLNSGWRNEWGGALELWDREMQSCKQKIYPVLNRLVVFSTTEHSWHGHPDPLQCPEGTTRKSIALYYYSNGRPEEERASSHNTVFQVRPGEVLKPTAKERLRDFIPPVLLKLASKARHRQRS